MSQIDVQARNSGYYKVFVNGAEYSQHTAEREAIENATEALAADPSAAVYYTHDYVVDVTLVGSSPAPEPEPEPTPEPEPEPIPEPSGAWLDQRWNYADIGALLADPHHEETTWQSSDGELALLTGLSGTPEGFDKALRITFYGNPRSDQQVGMDLSFPNASQVKAREVWIETYVRFSDNWTTKGPRSGNEGHKFIFLWDQSPSPDWRWEIMEGVFGTDMQVMIGGASHGFHGGVYPMETLWDGEWTPVRIHAKMANSGAFEVEIDGNQIGYTGANTNRGSGYYFASMSLSRNLNKGAAETMHMDVGPIRVFTSDPGWV